MSLSSISYKDAGVDIEAGNNLVDRIKPLAKSTFQFQKGVLNGIGGFAGLFELSKEYKNPVLVSGTDGVGTKIKLAVDWNMHETIGIDLVAMCVNDILVQGAKPLFFLDYFACGKLNIDQAEKIIKGIAKGCELSECALLGGETAEMPGMYREGEYDLAGFSVGVVEKEKILTGENIKAGDVILGLASHGIHSNGFSLVRKCIEKAKNNLPTTLDNLPFQEAIMKPTRIYVKNILNNSNNLINGLVHITGGGLLENIPRILSKNTKAIINKNNCPKTEIFNWLQKLANIDDNEMFKVFNNGIGMVIILPKKNVDICIKTLTNLGEKVFNLGFIDNNLNNSNLVEIL